MGCGSSSRAQVQQDPDAVRLAHVAILVVFLFPNSGCSQSPTLHLLSEPKLVMFFRVL